MLKEVCELFKIENDESLPLMEFVGKKLNCILYIYDKEDFEFVVPISLFTNGNFELIKLASFKRREYYSIKSFVIGEDEFKVDQKISDNIYLFCELVNKELKNKLNSTLLGSVNIQNLPNIII